MNKEQAINYLRCSGFSDKQIKAIEGAFSCPSAGIDCEDCPAYEDSISRKAVMEICNEEWDSDLIVERIGQLPSVKDIIKVTEGKA